MSKVFDNKSFVNPANHEETFSWNDLMNDYKFCKRQRKLAEYEHGAKFSRWFDYRKLALKCYYYDQEEFTNLLCKEFWDFNDTYLVIFYFNFWKIIILNSKKQSFLVSLKKLHLNLTLLLLVDMFEEKQKYINYLVEEGSVMSDAYRNKSGVFDIREKSIFNSTLN